jgi:hypothetical protein
MYTKSVQKCTYECIYDPTHVYICAYISIYIERERERERENMIVLVGLSEGTKARQEGCERKKKNFKEKKV